MYSKNEYFKSQNRTLGTRVDLAWEKLNSEISNEKEKRDALEFLVFAFDLDFYDNPDMSLKDQVSLMMLERDIYRNDNPEYIPNQAPKFLDKIIHPSLRVIPQTSRKGDTDIQEVKDAIANKELLDVTKSSKKMDRYAQPVYLSPDEREGHRLIIRNGEFYHEGNKFDSSKFISHEKKGFVAYTLNANGEISFFKHLGGGQDEQGRVFYHSSMNAGAPVIAAGELKIEDGKLTAITTHSGHYQPSLFNIYRLLNHLEDKGVDLKDTKVLTLQKIPESISMSCKKSSYHTYDGSSLRETLLH